MGFLFFESWLLCFILYLFEEHDLIESTIWKAKISARMAHVKSFIRMLFLSNRRQP